ncbi:MAG: polyprenyl synthetase family protein [Parachlamydiaceae bacterium]
MAERLPSIESTLAHLIPEDHATPEVLSQAARYSLLGGGKRIRPLLALATTEALGMDWQKALTSACSLELVHTYSLVHDDLPCMDDDDFRRGKPSLHKHYNEGIATLAGDYLLTHAFYILAKDPELNDTQKTKMVQCLAEKAGGTGMIAGQILDIEAKKYAIDIQFLKKIHLKKTGQLMAASIEFGAIFASAHETVREDLSEFGEKIGLAFQIIDDVLDVTNSEAKHGKQTSSDSINGKTTYATLLGIEGSQKLAQQYLQESIALLQKHGLENSILTNFAQFLVARKI